jgi:hypothetical protein
VSSAARGSITDAGGDTARLVAARGGMAAAGGDTARPVAARGGAAAGGDTARLVAATGSAYRLQSCCGGAAGEGGGAAGEGGAARGGCAASACDSAVRTVKLSENQLSMAAICGGTATGAQVSTPAGLFKQGAHVSLARAVFRLSLLR